MNSNYRKYLKYKTKYLNLKDSNSRLINKFSEESADNKTQIGGNDKCYSKALELQKMVGDKECGNIRSTMLLLDNILGDLLAEDKRLARSEGVAVRKEAAEAQQAPQGTVETLREKQARALKAVVSSVAATRAAPRLAEEEESVGSLLSATALPSHGNPDNYGYIAVTTNATREAGRLDLESIRQTLQQSTGIPVKLWIVSSKEEVAYNAIAPPKKGRFLVVIDAVEVEAPRLGLDSRPAIAFPNEIDAFLRQGPRDIEHPIANWENVAKNFDHKVIWLFVYDSNATADQVARIRLALTKVETQNLHSGTGVGTIRRYERYVRGVPIQGVNAAIKDIGDKIKEKL